ncbi:MAG: hypothetical protein M4579_005539 [Chaenotheca gracillima]|nr:MAG: hypothetical protein M4579_005539 [Chaenotheca gracillima]
MPNATPWERTKAGSKKGFDKVWSLADKLGAPVNRLSNKLGAEAFWPTTLDKESDKAARILRSFCKDGFFEEEVHQTQDGPKQKQKVLKKIPQKVIAEAKGLAIFTTMRSGLWVSGAGGSGILVARKPDGSWSPPSGIMLHTAGLGFLIGVDIYDCVVVINTEDALKAFTKIRCTLGAEVSAVAGPVGAGGILESELHKRRAPIWTYLKSRGFYAGVQIDGTVIIERTDENERFYGEKIGVGDIMAGKVRHPPYELRTLMETIRAAQGDMDVDESALPSSPPPGDLEIERNDSLFGVPDKEDPDPYGVLALEKEGLEIREAGSKSRPASEQFDFRPSPTSPIFNNFNRKSTESFARRESLLKRQSVDRSTQTGSIGTQTDDQPRSSSRTSTTSADEPRHDTNGMPEPTSPEIRIQDEDMKSSETQNESPPQEEKIEFHEPAKAAQAAPQVITKARLVSIPKRIPPALPPRSPARRKIIVNGDDGPRSPTHQADAGTSPRLGKDPDSERDGWSEVALDGKASPPAVNGIEGRKSSTESREKVEDKDDTSLAPITMGDNEEKTEANLEDAHETAPKTDVGEATPTVEKGKHETLAATGTDDDDFHSIPTTPEESVR